MDYTNLLNDGSGRVSRVGVVGATKGYGYTLLAQIPTALDQIGAAWYLNSVQYEEETGLIHYEWVWEVV